MNKGTNMRKTTVEQWLLTRPRAIFFILFSLFISGAHSASRYDNPDTIVVARDGTGQFRTVSEAIEVCRAFMDYHKVIYIKKGTYKEKVIIPQWLQNIELCGEDRDQTVITFDDHANILYAPTGKGMGTFRTYTVRIDGNDITLKNLTVENNAARLGQAVALHTQGDRLRFINCRFLGNQDTIYTGMPRTRMLFDGCYIEGTTDFIFGPSTAWFEGCTIHCKADSYINARGCPLRLCLQPLHRHGRCQRDESVLRPSLARLRLHAVYELPPAPADTSRGMAPLGEATRTDRPLSGVQQPR